MAELTPEQRQLIQACARDAASFDALIQLVNDVSSSPTPTRAAQRSINENAMLLAAANAILIHQHFEDSARTIFDFAKDITGATSGYVALLSDDGSENEVLFLDAGGLPCDVDPELPMPIRGLRAEAYHLRKAVYDNDFHHSEWMQFMPGGHVRLDNVMFAPLVIDDKAVGLMGLANKDGPFTDEDGRMATVLGQLAAIALHNSWVLDSLRESQQKSRALLNAPTDAITLLDPDGVILDLNETMALRLGKPVDELIGCNILDLLPPDVSERRRAYAQQVLDTGQMVRFEDERAGIWSDTVVYPISDPAGTVQRLAVIAHDITERKHMEESLRKVARIVQNSPAILFRWHPSKGWPIAYVSENVTQCFGYSVAELLSGRVPFASLVHPDDLAQVQQEIQDYMDRGVNAFQQTYRIVTKAGAVRWVDDRTSVIRDDQGQIERFEGLVMDITDRKEAEQRKLELAVEQEKVKVLQQFIADASHDLKTPLAAIEMSLSLVPMLRDTVEREQQLDVVSRQVRALSRLVQNMLSMSKLDMESEYCFEPVDLNQLLQQMLQDVRPAVASKHLELVFEPSPTALVIEADEDYLSRAIQNVLDNAIKFTPEPGQITVRHALDDGHAIIEVQDTGPGIAANDMPFIFERFFRADKARSTPDSGSGLGLAIAKKVINAHGGRIDVESQPEQGSTFRLTLPTSRGPDTRR